MMYARECLDIKQRYFMQVSKFCTAIDLWKLLSFYYGIIFEYFKMNIWHMCVRLLFLYDYDN